MGAAEPCGGGVGRDLVADVTGPASSDEAAPARSAPRWRRILSATLIVLGCLLAPAAIHSVWLHDTLLKTDQYVATISPLARNAAVQHALADRISNTLISGTNLRTTAHDLVTRTPGQSAIPPGVSQIVRRHQNLFRLAAVGVGLLVSSSCCSATPAPAPS